MFVGSSLAGAGVARVMLNLAGDWSEAGADMTVATLMRGAGDAYPVPAGVRRIALDLPGKSSDRRSLLRNNIALVAGLRRILRRERPDIAIAHGTISFSALALARSRDCIAIGAEHIHPPSAIDNNPILGRLRTLAVRLLLPRLDAAVALTSQSADWLRAHTSARHVAAIPNAIALPVADGAPRLPPADTVAPQRRILLAVGQFARYKGFDRLLDAFAQLAPRHPDWDLVILGEGRQRPALEAQAARLGLDGRAHLPGHAGNVADWYRAAGAFVLSSRWEGWGMVLVEAMAHGCAVLSVDCDTGPRDIIRDGEDGLLVAQNDPAALVAGLDRLLGDAALRMRLGGRAVEVVERFSPQRIRARWQALFDEL